jgi:hypothetical protein
MFVCSNLNLEDCEIKSNNFRRKNMKKVIIESPFAGDVKKNIEYARKCMRDSLLRGEAPLASHLLYTQDGILDDTKKNLKELWELKLDFCGEEKLNSLLFTKIWE